MADMLNDLSNRRAVIQAIEENMFSFWMNYGRVEGCEVFEDERLMHFTTSVPFPLMNGVFRAQLTVSQIEPTISETLQHFAAQRMPMFWWTGPATLPSDLGKYLVERGLRDNGRTPGMAMLLSDLPENVSVPADFHIEVVQDMNAMKQWMSVLAVSNDVYPSLHQEFADLEAIRGLDLPISPRRYLGFLNDEPVTASALHLDAGVAGIYAVATVHQARGKGLGAAITLQPLQDARQMGYKVGILQASSMGHSVYKRLGFKDFCDLGIYMFVPT